MSKNGQFLIEFLGKEVTKMLMEEYGWDLRKAMDTFLRSKTYVQVEDVGDRIVYSESSLYFQYLAGRIERIKVSRSHLKLMAVDGKPIDKIGSLLFC